jgi:uncharacterized protein
LIRFVAAPDGTVTPDLKAVLPGRGCWVTAERDIVDKAVRRGLFARALKAGVVAPDDLASNVDRAMARQLAGTLGLLRKAGHLVQGAAKVEDWVRSGRAAFTLHATDAAADGVRKMTQARRAVLALENVAIDGFALFTSAEMSLALGGENVIHAAAIIGRPSAGARDKCVALARYRGMGRLDLELSDHPASPD